MTDVTAEGEGLRLDRLRRVEAELGYAISEKISRLHDHKGVLFVNWTERPNAEEINIILDAWGRYEKVPVVYHYEMGVELVDSAIRYNPFQGSNGIRRAAIEHLRAARNLLKKSGTRIKKSGSPSKIIKRHFQSLKLAESALRHARSCQRIEAEQPATSGDEGPSR